MKLAQFKNGKYFFQKKVPPPPGNSADNLFFIAWGWVHKPGDKKFVKLYDTKNMIHI